MTRAHPKPPLPTATSSFRAAKGLEFVNVTFVMLPHSKPSSLLNLKLSLRKGDLG